MRLIGEVTLRYDVINIHYVRPFYLLIRKILRQKPLVLTTYGSDLWRANPITKRFNRYMYAIASAITVATQDMKDELNKIYKNRFDKKIEICRFGLDTLEEIDRIKEEGKDKKELKKELGYDPEKIIITCGYNSTKAQNHVKIIKAIDHLPLHVKEVCQFVFPLAYGDEKYKKLVLRLLTKKEDMQYIVIGNFLHGRKNALIKNASDIMINVLKTDALSGSMQEHIYAGNHIIAGEWLPYGMLEKMGIVWDRAKGKKRLQRTRPDYKNLASKIEKAIMELGEKDLSRNKDIIKELSSWQNNIPKWNKVLIEDNQKRQTIGQETTKKRTKLGKNE